jgi:hypothetical protein
MSDSLPTVAASFDDVDNTFAECEGSSASYRQVGSSHDVDTTGIAKDKAGTVGISHRHDEPTRHGAAVG